MLIIQVIFFVKKIQFRKVGTKRIYETNALCLIIFLEFDIFGDEGKSIF